MNSNGAEWTELRSLLSTNAASAEQNHVTLVTRITTEAGGERGAD